MTGPRLSEGLGGGGEEGKRRPVGCVGKQTSHSGATCIQRVVFGEMCGVAGRGNFAMKVEIGWGCLL